MPSGCLLSFALGVFIVNIYFWTHAKVPQKSFTDTLIILCMLISVVMVVIGDSIARAFSLVGALSIIRFRTAIQDPTAISVSFLRLGCWDGSRCRKTHLSRFWRPSLSGSLSSVCTIGINALGTITNLVSNSACPRIRILKPSIVRFRQASDL